MRALGIDPGLVRTGWAVVEPAGLRAVVRYKPAADKSAADEVVSCGFRDDLPAPPASAEAAKPN